MTLAIGKASVQIVSKDGLIYVHDLKGEGSVSDMRKLIKKIKEISELTPLYFAVTSGDRALNILTKYGASKHMEVWQYGR